MDLSILASHGKCSCLAKQLQIICIIYTYAYVKGNWVHFNHPSIESKNLACAKCCIDRECGIIPTTDIFYSKDFVVRCCTTSSSRIKPIWELGNEKYNKERLFVEYTSVKGTAKVIQRRYGKFYYLLHEGGYLTRFPDNIQDFPNIVEINFSNNKLNTMPTLDCLQILDTLIMTNNNFTSITSSAFANLSSLRYLDFSNNHISFVEPGALSHRPRSLMYINLSQNRIKTLDVRDFILGCWFTYYNLSNNELSTITNKNKWKGFSINDVIGGGRISLQYNKFIQFPDVSKIGFKDEFSALRLAYSYAIEMMNNFWICDCYLWADYLETILKVADYFPSGELLYRIPCSNPPELRNFTIVDFHESKEHRDLLICNITVSEKCPNQCNCYKQPSRNRTVVLCKNKLFDKMPNRMPNYNNLDIDLSYNNIKRFEYFNYMDLCIKLNLSNNKISVINSSIFTIKSLSSIDLSANNLQFLPETIRYWSPCFLILGELTITCTCQLQWLGVWLQRQTMYKCENNQITCVMDGEEMDATKLTADQVCNEMDEIISKLSAIIIIVLALVTVTLILLQNFKYEIYLVWRRLQCRKWSNKTGILAKYDIYVSFEEENVPIRLWISQIMIRFLEENGYSVFLPCRDLKPGGVREQQIRSKIRQCQSFIVIPSQNFMSNPYEYLEWKVIWNSYKESYGKSIIVVNYDLIEGDNVFQKNLKAFIRLGFALDFSDTGKTLLSNIKKKLGEPITRYKTGLENYNPRYKHVINFDLIGAK